MEVQVGRGHEPGKGSFRGAGRVLEFLALEELEYLALLLKAEPFDVG